MSEDTIGTEKDIMGDTVSVVALWMYYAIWFMIGFFSLTAGRGLEEEQNFITVVLFSIPFAIYAGLVTSLKVLQNLGKGKRIVTYIHDTEVGIFGKFNFVSDPIKFIFVSFGLFLLISFIGAFTQSSIGSFFFPWDVGVTPEVATPAKLVFGLYNAPSENAWLYMMISVFVTIELLLMGLLKIPARLAYWSLFVPNVIMFGWIWLQIHNLVNSSAQQGLAHFMFGATNTALVMGTGSIIPTEAYHLLNNFFVIIRDDFGNQVLVTLFSSALVLYFVITALVFFFRRKRRSN